MRVMARNGPDPVPQCSPTITTPARRGSLAAATVAGSALQVSRSTVKPRHGRPAMVNRIKKQLTETL
jgi:hypothetical protein